MRKLITQDVFNALRAIKKANLREELKPILKLAGSGNLNIEDVGLEGMLSVIEIFSEKKSEKAIYEVLSGPFEKTVEEIENMNLIDLAENLEAIVGENDIKRFFTLLAGLNSKK